MASVTRKPARTFRNVLANVLEAVIKITLMQFIIRLIYTNIVEKAVMPKTLAEVVKLLKRVDNRNKSSHVIVRTVCIFTILADCQELRQLCAVEVTSKVLAKRLKKRGNMPVIETGKIAEVLVLGHIGIIIYGKVRYIEMVIRQIFGVVRESEKVLTPAVLLIHCKVVGKTAHIVFIPAEVATFIANSTRNIQILATLTGGKVWVSYLGRTETH